MISPLISQKNFQSLPRSLAEKLRALGRRYGGASRALAITASYGAWILAFRLLILTFITYFVMSSPGPGGSGKRFEEVSEAFSAAEIGIIGLSALTYVTLALALNPLASRSLGERLLSLFSAPRLTKRFLPGFANGAILGGGMVLAFLLSGSHRYLGFFIQSETLGFAVGSFFLRMLGLLSLAYFEEFIFRQKILESLRAPEAEGGSPSSRLPHDLAAAALISILYCAIKLLQFDLGLMHLLTLFLVSFLLSLRTLSEKDYGWGAGYWAALLIVFNPLLSLPVLGTEFSGALLVKPESSLGEVSSSTVRFLTGGAGGPLSAFALQVLLAFDILRSLRQYLGQRKPF